MQYQIEIMLHSQNHTISIKDDNFAMHLSRSILDDFEIEGNNSRLVMLSAYVKSVYSLYKQEQTTKQMLHKIELLS